jgi:hypothetical protein
MSSSSDEKERVGKFVEYPCFYCGTNIESKEHLKDHKKSCHDKFIQLRNSKSLISKLKLLPNYFPPIGFPPVGFPPVGFPPFFTSNLSPFYASWNKKSL